jgi:hypothetical protein
VGEGGWGFAGRFRGEEEGSYCALLDMLLCARLRGKAKGGGWLTSREGFAGPDLHRRWRQRRRFSPPDTETQGALSGTDGTGRLGAGLEVPVH